MRKSNPVVKSLGAWAPPSCSAVGSTFRAACTGSPFLSTAASVSLSRIGEERAPGESGTESLSGVGVLLTRAGTVDTTFVFADDPSGVTVVNIVATGTPLLPMAAATAVKSGASR